MSQSSTANLVSHRDPRSVWDKRGWQGVTVEERLAPGLVSLGGAILLAYGLTRRSWRGTGYAVAGAALLGCAARGLCNPRHAGVHWKHLLRNNDQDQVTEALLDSFPASDAPSLATTATARAHV